MQTKHTPTPYKTKHLGGGTVGLALVNADYEINGLKLGCIYASKDAEFIVRACNSHDELVEANRLEYDETATIGYQKQLAVNTCQQ